MDLLFIIILGGLWGSFANVCIVRLPVDKGVVTGRSTCPKCRKQIKWYDNIPIFSYIFLGGKCRKCKKKISFRYVLVEIISILSIFPYYVLSLIGGIFGYAIIWGIIYFYKQIKNKEGMGLGDAKLLAVIGFWFGLDAIPFVIFLSSAIALVLVTPDLIKKTKKMSTQIPFGPYIIVGNLIFLLLEKQLQFFIL